MQDRERSTRGPFIAALLLMALALGLDAPWGNAFYRYHALTETLGSFFFASMASAFGLSGVPLSFFEASSMGLALWALAASGARAFRAPFSGPALSADPVVPQHLAGQGASGAAWFLVLALPLAILVGVLSGLAGGHPLGTMLTQTRSMVTFPLWMTIGLCVLTTPSRGWILLMVLTGVSFLKAFQGILQYLLVLGRNKRGQEYLIEHISSEFFSTSVIVILVALWAFKEHRRILLVAAGFILPVVLVAFLLNDRRAALVGVLLAGAVGVAALPRAVWARLWPYAVGVLALGCLYLAVTWDADGIFGFPARTLQSLFDPDESSSGYRRVENANLLLSVASDPLFGIGFGQRFPIVYPLPDISRFYEEYDLVPHNTLLFLWAFAGPLGFAFFGTLVAGVLGSSIRLARLSGLSGWRRDSRVTGFACIVGIVMVKSLAYVYADLGLREVRLLAEVGLLSGGLLAMGRHHLLVPKESLAR